MCTSPRGHNGEETIQNSLQLFGTNSLQMPDTVHACFAGSKCSLGLHIVSPILDLELRIVKKSLQSSSVHKMVWWKIQC